MATPARERTFSPRLVANVGAVNLAAIKGHTLTDDEWGRIADAVAPLNDLPLYWSERTTWTPATVSASIGAFKRSHPDLGVVVIDYLQLMQGDSRTHSRQEEVAQMTRALKLAAKRHGVPIMLLAQLNRASEQRADRRPQLTDLRESGAIEQDADVILMLHDPSGGGENPDGVGELDILIRKHRGGQTGAVMLSAQFHYSRLADLAHPSDQAREF